MAIKAKHKSENLGVSGFLKKNFGKSGNKSSFFENVALNSLAPYFGLGYLGKSDDAMCTLGFVNLVAVGAASMFGAYEIAHTTDQNVDFNPAYETAGDAAAEDAVSRVFSYNDNLYLLRHNEQGVQLYSQLKNDDSLTDDIFVLMDRDDAPRIARAIGEVYKGIYEQQQGVIDIWSDFESVREDEPIVMQYEGISGVFGDTVNNAYYIIADNVESEANARWEPTADTAEQGYNTWVAALEAMAAGDYNQYPMGIEQGIDLNEVNTDGFLTWLQVIGSLSALGALGGAAYSIGSSRRRFNQELNR